MKNLFLKFRLPGLCLLIVSVIAGITVLNYVSYKDAKNSEPITLPQEEYVPNIPRVEPIKVENERDFVENQVLLTFENGTSEDEINKYVESIGGKVEVNIDKLDSVVVSFSSTVPDKFPENTILASSEKDYLAVALGDKDKGASSESYQLSQSEIENTNYTDEVIVAPPLDVPEDAYKPVQPFNDPEYINQWGMQVMGIEDLLRQDKSTQKETIVAVIDSGICIDHPDLAGKIVKGYDFVENDNIPQDDFDHGCGVAGIIAANIDNENAITGAAPNAKIMPLKVLDSQGIGQYSDIASAIIYAVDHKAKYVNISAGGIQDSILLKKAVDYAKKNNVVIIAAAGNTYSEEALYPARYESVISVGSIGQNFYVSNFSSRDKAVDYWAPGESIVSLTAGNSTSYFSGTSFAAPYITSLYVDGILNSKTKLHGGMPTAEGNVLSVNFDSVGTEVIGWGTTEFDPKNTKDNPQEEFLTAQSSTACVTRYDTGWWAGAYCYIQGTLQTGTSTQYKIVTSGKTYNLNLSNASQYLNKTVKVEVKYTSQWSFTVLSVTLINNVPIGYFDNVDIYTLKVNGWAFDPDTPSQSINVHVYIDGPAGSGAPGYAVLAGNYRGDVNAVYGITGNHGFSWPLPSQFTSGTHTFYVYAINSWGGANPQISRSPLQATIPVFDYDPPSDKITSISNNTSLYGKLVPQGENAEKLSEANTSISYEASDPDADPVNTATGFLDYSVNDIGYTEINGIPFDFIRAYNSDSNYSGILGTGWQASFDMKLIASVKNGTYGWTVLFPDGHGETFNEPDNNYRTFDYQFTNANSENKGTLFRYGATGGPAPWAVIYIDSQTGKQFSFRAERVAGSMFGKMIQIKNPDGSVVDYSYDANGKLSSATEQTFGRKFNFSIDASGRLTTITDVLGRPVTYSYDANGKLAQVVNTLGGVTKYFYNAENKIRRIEDPNGNTTYEFVYDGSGRVSAKTNGTGQVTTYSYLENGGLKITTITDPNGNSTIHKHNDKNYFVEKIAPNGDVTSYTYDDKGQRLSETFPDGKIYHFEYDTKGNRTKTIYPNGYEVATVYNDSGKPTKITEGNNDRITEYGYDSKFNLTSVTDPEGNTVTYEYNTNNQLIGTISIGENKRWDNNFFSGPNWDPTKTVVTTGDVNGDGLQDIVGFGIDDIYVALSNADGFDEPQIWHSTNYTLNDWGWSVSMHPRMLADVNGDGKDDIVGFGGGGVYVSLSDGARFLEGSMWSASFVYNLGWRVEKHIRVMGDVNGDGKDDIVGFGDDDIFVALSTGSSFGGSQIWRSDDFTYNDWGWRVEANPRTLGDINGDGKDDIVGFAGSVVAVAISNGTQFLPTSLWTSEFSYNQGWRVGDHERYVSDINEDGKADIVGFKDDAVYTAFSTGTSYQSSQVLDRNFNVGDGWNFSSRRFAGDLDGDGKTDLFGLKSDGIYATTGRGKITSLSYDAKGYLAAQKNDNANATTSYTNNLIGFVQSKTDPNGNTSQYTYNSIGNKTSETDANGNTKTLEYDLAGNLTKEIEEAGVETVYVYDANYNVVSKQVGDAQITSYQYDAGGRKIKEIAPEGNYVVYSYDANGRLTKTENFGADDVSLGAVTTTYNSSNTKASETDANGVPTTYTYDALGRLASETKAGKTKTYTYDQWANLTSESDWEGNVSFFAYDKNNNKVLEKNPIEVDQRTQGKISKYDAAGNQIEIVDSMGGVTKQYFDTEKRLIKVVNPKGQMADYTYAKNGNLLSQINFAGEISTFNYDGNGNLTSKTDNLGNVTAFTYNSRNQNTSIIDVNGNVTSMQYDQYGNLVQVTNAEGGLRTFSYDLNGNLISETDELGNTKTYAYNSLGKRTAETETKQVAGELTEVTRAFEYDSKGNLTAAVNERGHTINYSYNAFDKVTTVENPDGTSKGFSYDGNGNVLTSTDELGNVTSFTYDKMGRKLSETDPADYTQNYAYDLLGRLVSESDKKANETNYEYDSVGNVTKVTDRGGNETTVAYDGGNRILTVNYPNGLELTNAYDGLGRKLSETKSGASLPSSVVEQYSYDDLGNLISKTDANGSVTTFTYDDLNRQLAENKPLGLTAEKTYDAAGNVISQTDENGNTTTFAYDPAGSVTRRTDALGVSTSYKYDAAGNLMQEINGNSVPTYYSYDSRNRKTETKDRNLEVLESLEYDGAGNVTLRYDANSYATEFTYTSTGLLASTTDPAGNTISYSYDENGNILTEANQLGFVTSYAYDSLDQVIHETDPLGNMWVYEYDQAGNPITGIDPLNRTLSNQYDELGRKIKVSQNSQSMGVVETDYEYDNNGNLVQAIDPMGNITVNVYDALNRRLSTTNAENETKYFSYDGVGNITQTIDANGNSVEYSYDDVYRKIAQTDELDYTTGYSYDDAGNLLSITKPRGNLESYAYDDFGRKISYTDGEGNVTDYEYDRNGNLTAELRPNGTRHTYGYDALNRPIVEYSIAPGEDPVARSRTDYDAAGRVIKTTDALGNFTTYEYDGLDRLTKVIDPLQHSTFYSYDAVGNLTREINANGAVTNYTFDEFNNLITETDPTSHTWSYEYDKNGNIAKETDANGNVNTREYDFAGRITAKEYLDGNNNPQAESTYFEYDNAGNLIRAYNQAQENVFDFDERSSITGTSDSRNYTQSYTYDANNLLETHTFADGHEQELTYNQNDQVSQMKMVYNGDSVTENDSYALSTLFEYDSNGNLNYQINPDKTVISKTYDALDQVVEVNNYMSADASAEPGEPAWKTPEYVLAKYNYELNANGQKLSTDFFSNCDKDNVCSAGTNVSTTDNYAYDAAGRLVQSSRTIDNPTQTIEKVSYTDNYTYDAVGNRTAYSSTQSGSPVTVNYAYNLSNQLTGSDDGWSYSYDADGNRTAKSNSSTGEYVNMTYNRADEMTGVDSSLKDESGNLETYNLSYTYDVLGRRIKKQVNASDGSETYDGILFQNYLYQTNGWDMVSEYTDREIGTDLHTNYYMAKLDSSLPSQVAAEDVLDRTPESDYNLWDSVADESSSEIDPEHNFILTPDTVQRISYYQRDALDSIVSRTNLEVRYKASDTSGTLVLDPTVQIIDGYGVNSQSRTDAYGKKLNETETASPSQVDYELSDWQDTNWSSRSYSGQVYDRESGTYYYGSRNYDPTSGTWNKQDSYRGEPKSPLSRNRYIFVEGDPVNSVDEYGYSIFGKAWDYAKRQVNRSLNNVKKVTKVVYNTSKSIYNWSKNQVDIFVNKVRDNYNWLKDYLKNRGGAVSECIKNPKKCSNDARQEISDALGKGTEAVNHIVQETKKASQKAVQSIESQLQELLSASEIESTIKEKMAQIGIPTSVINIAQEFGRGVGNGAWENIRHTITDLNPLYIAGNELKNFRPDVTVPMYIDYLQGNISKEEFDEIYSEHCSNSNFCRIGDSLLRGDIGGAIRETGITNIGGIGAIKQAAGMTEINYTYYIKGDKDKAMEKCVEDGTCRTILAFQNGDNEIKARILGEQFGYYSAEAVKMILLVKMAEGGERSINKGSDSSTVEYKLNSNWKDWDKYMAKRGWTDVDIVRTIKANEYIEYNKTNYLNPGNPTKLFTDPKTGKSLVIDAETGEIIQLGGDPKSFKF
ncbi:S8 family serine peptidase [Candidatus Dojkabacteria bacterium]|nr:S8 family serine peptidase [Candidatus Dojkabacteria bacterium]